MMLIQLGRIAIREDDRSRADIAPRPGRVIDDCQPGGLALELAHIEPVLPHVIIVVSGGRAHRFAVHEQADARLARMIAAADPKAYEIALDRERLAGQRSRATVLGLDAVTGGRGVRVHNTRP